MFSSAIFPDRTVLTGDDELVLELQATAVAVARLGPITIG